MKNYIVKRTPVVFSICMDGQKKEFSLKKGDTVALPPENPTTRTLLQCELIRETPESETTAGPAPDLQSGKPDEAGTKTKTKK